MQCRYTGMFECKNQLFQKTTERIAIVSSLLGEALLGEFLVLKV